MDRSKYRLSLSLLKENILRLQNGEYTYIVADSLLPNKVIAGLLVHIDATRNILKSRTFLNYADYYQRNSVLKSALLWYERVCVDKSQPEITHQFYHNSAVCLAKLEIYDRSLQNFFEVTYSFSAFYRNYLKLAFNFLWTGITDITKPSRHQRKLRLDFDAR